MNLGLVMASRMFNTKQTANIVFVLGVGWATAHWGSLYRNTREQSYIK